uniref:Bromo domain-containing protein n=1 Tax=Timema shepardi TaxID=629360 RepID=A0A7R9G567_TIMSH|nr:unnamed protein product [Timema shepardi]
MQSNHPNLNHAGVLRLLQLQTSPNTPSDYNAVIRGMSQGLLSELCVAHSLKVYCPRCVLLTVSRFTVRAVCCSQSQGLLSKLCVAQSLKVYDPRCVLLTVSRFIVRAVCCSQSQGLLSELCVAHSLKVYCPSCVLLRVSRFMIPDVCCSQSHGLLSELCVAHSLKVYYPSCVLLTVSRFIVRGVCCSQSQGLLFELCVAHSLKVYDPRCVLLTVSRFIVRAVCCSQSQGLLSKLCVAQSLKSQGLLSELCVAHSLKVYDPSCVLLTVSRFMVRDVCCSDDGAINDEDEDYEDEEMQPSRRSHRRSQVLDQSLPLDNAILQDLLMELIHHKDAWPFLRPVQKAQVPDYHLIIKRPMDFGRIKNKLNMLVYVHNSEFIADTLLVFENCQMYNQSEAEEYKYVPYCGLFLTPRYTLLVFENCQMYNQSEAEEYKAGARMSRFFRKRCRQLGLQIPEEATRPPAKKPRPSS